MTIRQPGSHIPPHKTGAWKAMDQKKSWPFPPFIIDANQNRVVLGFDLGCAEFRGFTGICKPLHRPARCETRQRSFCDDDSRCSREPLEYSTTFQSILHFPNRCTVGLASTRSPIRQQSTVSAKLCHTSRRQANCQSTEVFPGEADSTRS